CADAVRLVDLRVDGRRAPLRVRTSGVVFPPGAGGLDTLRLTCSLEAAVDDGPGTRELRFSNGLYRDRVGWREITAVGDHTTLVASDAPVDSVSAALTAYPDDLLSSPLRQTEASVRFRSGGPAAPSPGRAAGLPSSADRVTERFTALVGDDLTPVAGLLALMAAVILGGAHSLAPGHGKTLMAAYLVGQRGSFRQAAVIGLTVTLTHTAGVLVLGLVLSVGTGFAPERLYPWFAVAGGLMVTAIGTALLRCAWARRASPGLSHHHHRDHNRDHAHGRGPGHGHPHHDHAAPMSLQAGPVVTASAVALHCDDQGGTTHSAGDVPSRGSLVAMGLAGGIVPTPSAILVLLGAVALGRAWFGVLLVVGYGLGMAATLIAAGLLLLRARTAVERRLAPGTRASWALATLPTVTAAIVLGAGLFLVARAVHQL
ncbi:MAG: nickel/cobalt transporter, partial [Acidimicrobiales bacterium]